MNQTTQEEPQIISPETEAKPYAPPAKKSHVPAGMEKLIFLGATMLVALVAVVVVFSHKMDPKAKQSTRQSKAAAAALQQNSPSNTGVMPSDTNTVRQQTDTDVDDISPADVLNTKNALEAQKRHADEDAAKAAKASAAGNSAPNPGQSPAGVAGYAPGQSPSGVAGYAVRAAKEINGSPKALGTIEPFHAPPYNGTTAGSGQPTNAQPGAQYQTGASYSEAMHKWDEEVTKPRILFARKSAPQATTEAASYLGPPITNFGLETGFHVAARLEASASTAISAPVTAVIEYNYERDGQIVLPAGSRAIGRIETADIHGNMAITFESVDLPNGASVPIKAVAVDTNLQALKGKVTGNNRALAMFVATMSGIGQTTAMALGNNNSSALSESDLMRAQLAQNMGQTSDTQIRQMLANQKVIVTLSAGTEFYMVFTKPALPHESSQPLPSANNAGHIQNTSGGQTAGH